MSRIRTNLITNRMANGAPTVSNGLVISGVTTSTTFSGSGASLTNLNASNIASGTVPTARLGSGTASSSTFLAGDSTYKTVTETTINNNADNRVITGSGTANTLEGESNLFFNGSQLGVNVTPDSGVHLHVQNSGEANMILEGDVNGIGGYLMLKNNNTTANTSMAIQFLDGGGQGTSEIKGIYADNSNNEGLLTFSTRPSGGSMTERLRIASDGKSYFVGANSGGFHATTLPNGNTVNINTITSNDGLSVIRYSGSYGPYALNIGRSKNDTIGTNALVANGDDLGHITWYGADGSDFNQAAAITVQVDGTPSNGTDMPGRILFKTTPNGSGTPVERMRIDASGRVTQPSQPSFSAHRSSNNWDVSTGSVLPWDQTRHNTGSHFNTSNYRFTAPVAGTYEFSFYSIYNTNLASNNGAVAMRVNGSVPGQGTRCHFTKTNSNWDHVSYSVKYYLNANDYIDMVSDGGQTIRYHGGQWSSFTGQLVS